MILAVDPVCSGFEHAHVNAGLLATLRCAYPKHSIVFLGESAHATVVEEYLSRNGVEGVTVCSFDYGRNAPRNWLQEKLGPFFLCREVLEESERRGAVGVVFCASTKAHLLHLNLLLRTKYRRSNVLAVAHTLMQNLVEGASSPWRPSLASVLRWAHPERLRIVVPGESIRTRALELVPSARLSSLDLAYFFPKREEDPPSPPPVRFGFLGVASLRKGIDLFYRLASELSTDASPAAARFCVVGCMEDVPPEPWARAPVETVGGRHMLPEEVRTTWLRRIHVAVFPYAAERYQLVASAAFLDAVSAAAPVLALRTPFFEEQFQRFGDIGALCNSYEELRDTARSWRDDLGGARYAQRRENLRRARATFTPAALAEHVRRLWSVPEGEGEYP